jgi:hypothetical protein
MDPIVTGQENVRHKLGRLQRPARDADKNSIAESYSWGGGLRITNSISMHVSAATGGFDGGDVDLFHGHHSVEGALGLSATGGEGIG